MFDPNIDRICINANQSLYAYNLSGTCLFNVIRATLMERLLYMHPTLFDFDNAGPRSRLKAIICKWFDSGFCLFTRTFVDFCDLADSSLFSSMLFNPCHGLCCLLHTIHSFLLLLSFVWSLFTITVPKTPHLYKFFSIFHFSVSYFYFSVSFPLRTTLS